MQWTYEIHSNHLERGGRVSEEGGVCSLRKHLFQSLQGFLTFFYPESPKNVTRCHQECRFSPQ